MRFLTLAGLIFCSASQAASPGAAYQSPGASITNYYSSIGSERGDALRSSLHNIIDGHRAIKYTKRGNNWFDCWRSGKWGSCEVDVWEALSYTDAACIGNQQCDRVVLLYSGDIRPMSNANRGGGSPQSWDREHVWPKSRGFKKKYQDGYTDLHHLRPADRNINAAHSNYGYDEGGDVIYDRLLDGTPIVGGWVDRKNKSFEPTDIAKGQVARMLFYMATRYDQGDNNGDEQMPDLKLIDDNQRNHAPQIGDLCTLLKWNQKFPVSRFEKRRNDRVFQIQGNRNPFIDHPEFADKIWGHRCIGQY